MARIAVINAPEPLLSVFNAVTSGRFMTLSLSPLPSTASQFISALRGALPPQIVILNAESESTDSGAATRLASELTKNLNCLVVFCAAEPERFGLMALRSGAVDVIGFDSDEAHLRATLSSLMVQLEARKQAAAASATSPASQDVEGRVIGVFSPKGGAGKTVVATNLAVTLAQRYPRRVVLVDLDLGFGSCASGLALAEGGSDVLNAVQAVAAGDMVVLKTLLVRHEPSNLLVIPASATPAASDQISDDNISDLLTMLSRSFDYVVVDTTAGLPESTMAVLDNVTDAVFVTRGDVPGVRSLRNELLMLRQVSVLPDNRHVVLNFFDARHGIPVHDAQLAIGEGVDITLDDNPAVVVSVNKGEPVMIGNNARNPLTKGLTKLTERIVGKSPHVSNLPAFVDEPALGPLQSLELIFEEFQPSDPEPVVDPVPTPTAQLIDPAPFEAPAAPLPHAPTPVSPATPVLKHPDPVQTLALQAPPSPQQEPTNLSVVPASQPSPRFADEAEQRVWYGRGLGGLISRPTPAARRALTEEPTHEAV